MKKDEVVGSKKKMQYQNLDTDPDPNPDTGGGGGWGVGQPKMCFPPGKILGTPLLGPVSCTDVGQLLFEFFDFSGLVERNPKVAD
jgi:hypothetical protein